MFFEEEDQRFLNPEMLLVRHELFAISNLEVTPFGMRSVPTHTEDGIPIRKLYVSNLPLKTTRTELFGVFVQYGFIKSCWLRMGEKGPLRSPAPTYAFITYSNPADAHKALLAPTHEKMLRGRSLRVSPADSWHQPAEDSEGRVQWKPRGPRIEEEPSMANEQIDDAIVPEINDSESSYINTASQDNEEESTDIEQSYNILDILNHDCLTHILSYVPICDLIRSERVSKRWLCMVLAYFEGIRMFKTSWWHDAPVTLTTAVLRRVLRRLGRSLLRLHIDHHWSALNDRTAHTVGKFCPNLEELKIVGMHTKNWNPLIYGCTKLKNLSFISCNKLTDSSLVQLVKNDSCIESLTIANNTHVTGLFLTGSNPEKLHTLAFYNCFSLQGTVLSAAIDTIPNLKTLQLDVCPITMWKIIPLILSKLPKLEELSLSEYTSADQALSSQVNEAFCSALSNLTELKSLNLCRNVFITNAIMKQVSQTCTKLLTLNISSCNSRSSFPHTGISDEGVSQVCRGCTSLNSLDISYLGGLSDTGLQSVANCTKLTKLMARGNPAITVAGLVACLSSCHQLEELDVCGCDNVSEEVVSGAVRALTARPRPLLLRLASTAALQAVISDFPTHPKLTVNTTDDLSNPQLRPDFIDRTFDYSSDDSFDDMGEQFAAILGIDDEDLFLEDELEEYEHRYAYGLHAPDILLL